MRARLLAAFAVVGIVACQLVLVGDLEVRWTVDDSCAAYGVAQWEVTASGPEVQITTVNCNTANSYDTGTRFHGITEGTYLVTVRALDGSGRQLAERHDSGPVLSDVGAKAIVILSFKSTDFTAAPLDCGNGICEDTLGETCTSCPKDCGSCPKDCGNGICEDTLGETCTSCPKDCGICPSNQAKLNVYWNINGTLDGTAKADSWDKCGEVGAAYAAVTFDGTEHYLPCNQNNMTGLVNVSEGSHTISVALTDSSKTKITSETTPVTLNCTVAKPSELVVEFFWDSFTSLKNTQTGDFLFTTSFDGGKSCSQVSPQVTTQASLLYLSGSAVNPAPEVCGPNDVCYKMDGADTGECWGPDKTQKIKSHLWGEYQIAIRGIITGGNICYDAKDKSGSKKIDIVIGAGPVNPTVDFDLARDTASSLCQ